MPTSMPEHMQPVHRFSEGGPFDLQIDASEMGLKPGEWPDSIGVDYADTNVAIASKGDPIITRLPSGKDVFEGWKYTTEAGTRIAVWND